MKLVAIAYNTARVLLIIICCHQLALVYLDMTQAARMLQGADTRAYGRVLPELDAQSVGEVLKRRGDEAWFWIAGLGLIALMPYATVRKLKGPMNRKTEEEPNKPAQTDGDKSSK